MLFDRLRWRDPIQGGPLEPLVSARTPGGSPLSGALRIPGTSYAYPIVDAVARLTPELARRHRPWLEQLGLEPPPSPSGDALQQEQSVQSFGLQWALNPHMRSESDLDWRVGHQFGLQPGDFDRKLVLDAGAGTGDQSRWMLDQGAEVVSLDLSSAIDVVAAKLRPRPGWVGVQGDVTGLPLAGEQFDIAYCDGVLQHTRDTQLAVDELTRVVAGGGLILASHYERPRRRRGRVRSAYMGFLRRHLSRMDPYKVLLATGAFAALAYVPLVGRAVRMSGTALWYPGMPDFRTTWTNTLDFYGGHGYQRFADAAELWGHFERTGVHERVRASGPIVVARRVG